MNVLFLFHTYTFYPLDLNTYQFDFKLHYLAYVIFMSFPLDYLFIFYFYIITVYLYVLTSALGLQYVSINLLFVMLLKPLVHGPHRYTYETRTFVIDIACTIVVSVKQFTKMTYSFLVF